MMMEGGEGDVTRKASSESCFISQLASAVDADVYVQVGTINLFVLMCLLPAMTKVLLFSFYYLPNVAEERTHPPPKNDHAANATDSCYRSDAAAHC